MESGSGSMAVHCQHLSNLRIQVSITFGHYAIHEMMKKWIEMRCNGFFFLICRIT